MQSFDSVWQLRNGKKYDTANTLKMNDSKNTESSPIVNAPGRNARDELEVHALTQEEVNEQVRNHIGPLTKQLQDLTRLIQGMTTAQLPTSYLRPSTTLGLVQPGISPTHRKLQIAKVRGRTQKEKFRQMSLR